jgi:acyl-coenzyme A thioesterase PaaI-like protein
MSPRLLRWLFNLWPPFLLAGIHITRMDADWRRVDVELRMRPWNRNYVGTHFGGSLFAMADPFWMILGLHRFGPAYLVWDRAGDIEFLRPGRGTVRTVFQWDDALEARLRAQAADGSKVLHWFENDVIDTNGDVVARVRKQLYIRLKPAARPTDAGPA